MHGQLDTSLSLSASVSPPFCSSQQQQSCVLLPWLFRPKKSPRKGLPAPARCIEHRLIGLRICCFPAVRSFFASNISLKLFSFLLFTYQIEACRRQVLAMQQMLNQCLGPTKTVQLMADCVLSQRNLQHIFCCIMLALKNFVWYCVEQFLPLCLLARCTLKIFIVTQP